MRISGDKPGRAVFRWLFAQARPARFWMGASVGLGLAGGMLTIAQARLIATVIHKAAFDAAGRPELKPLMLILLTVIALRAIVAWAREISGFEASAAVRRAVRTALVRHVFALGPAFTREKSAGELSVSILERVDALHGFFAHYLPQMALAALIPLTILACVFPVSWAAGGILLFAAPLIPLFMALVGMGAENVSQKHFQALSRLGAHFLDVLRGLPTLRLLSQSRAEIERIRGVSRDYRLRTMAVLRIAFISSAVLEFFSAIAIAILAVYLGMTCLGYLGFGTWGRSLEHGDALFVLILAPDFFFPLRELGVHYHARADALAAGRDILRILDLPAPAPTAPLSGWRMPEAFTIRLDRVRLSYQGGKRPALDGVSLCLRQGEETALTGPSGAGKTSVINLLLGFAAPDGGSIRINGIPLAKIPPDAWRAHLAWVGQNPVLFHGTIRENIRMARPEAQESDIRAAAARARVTEFTDRLPAGLDTPVGERGLGLSRGQAQRVCLARAFLKNAPILLLDEPAAGLDAHNARRVMAGLRELKQGRTILTLTHDMDQAAGADRILHLEQGRLTPADGSPPDENPEKASSP